MTQPSTDEVVIMHADDHGNGILFDRTTVGSSEKKMAHGEDMQARIVFRPRQSSAFIQDAEATADSRLFTCLGVTPKRMTRCEGKMDIDHGVVASLRNCNDEDLRILVQQSMPLTTAIFASMPALAEDAAYEPFSTSWLKRHWRSLLAEVSGKPVDKLYDWALKTSAGSVAALLIQRFGFDIATYSEVIALAILLLRAAESESKRKPATVKKKKPTASKRKPLRRSS